MTQDTELVDACEVCSGKVFWQMMKRFFVVIRWNVRQVRDVSGRIRPSQELYSRLVHGYNRQLRPVRRPDVPVRVRLGASLVEVLGLDEARSHITLKIWVTLVCTCTVPCSSFHAVSCSKRSGILLFKKLSLKSHVMLWLAYIVVSIKRSLVFISH